MPTIDALQQAYSVSDSDELMISQSDIARKATRAQLLAGVQAALAIPSGTLLGRMSAGVGAPETIALGANLTIGNGALSAPSPFLIEGLPAGAAPMLGDLVAMGQAGQNTAVAYASFMSGLGQVGGVDASNLTVTATGAALARRLADCLADALTVESFGAIGDGVTDDTAAFAAAALGGKALRLDGRIYIVNGPLNLVTTNAIVGVAGASVIRRLQLVPSATWIEVSATSFEACGITFDAGGMAAADMPAVLVTPACTTLLLTACSFIHATGPSQGAGLKINGAAGSSWQITACQFDNNILHGLHAGGTGSVTVYGCEASGNGDYGFCIDANIACTLRNNTASGNGIGISIGSWTTGAASSTGGPSCVVSDNLCNSNSAWGIAVAAGAALVSGNTVQGNGILTPGGGILARLGASRLHGNIVVGGGYGIDARGNWGTAICGNHVSGSTTGIAVGGGQNIFVSGNLLLTNSWAILVSAIEPSLSSLLTGPATIAGNWIGFTTPQGGGIRVLDAAQGVAVADNYINGWGSATVNQAMWLHTDAAVVRGNRWNNQARFAVQANVIAGLEALVVPDVAEEVLVTLAPEALQSIMTEHQADTLGQIVFIKVIAGGGGYTQAQVAIAGTGYGASANAVVADGQVVWIVITNPGSGYGLIGSPVQITLTGDGSNASAVGYVGLPVLEGKQLRLSCNCQVQLSLSSSSPAQQSWTGFNATIPAFGAADMEGVFGGWRAVAFPPVDYLAPTGDGGAVLQSVAGGNLILRPASGGALHIASSSEASGCTSSVGRGSPIGTVTAPPGSDFRNLNGGAGNTFWIKQVNTDATGWIAIA
jgi:parallel beta-helix repeat protein